MGRRNSSSLFEVTAADIRPAPDEVEVAVIGPGYGESVVLHLGGDSWVVVDSCSDDKGNPRALTYLRRLGVDTSRQVVLVVATHWHDDHIGGLTQIVSECGSAVFCCSGAFLEREFLTAIAAFEENEPTPAGSGAAELFGVFSALRDTKRIPRPALADRRILSADGSEVWALSPDDSRFRDFLRTIGRLVPMEAQTLGRIVVPDANAVSVVLQIRTGETEILLGADLERSGWRAILDNPALPMNRAGVFKVPHHGSSDADEREVWNQMLTPTPQAVLAPWGIAGRTLPKDTDVRRILSRTPNAWATARRGRARPTPRRKEVLRAIRETGSTLLADRRAIGMVRLRCRMDAGSPWRVETFGDACHLRDYAA